MTSEEIAKLFEGAPGGATHYSKGNPDNGERAAFWREVGGKLVEFWGVIEDGGFIHLCNDRGYVKSPEECIARPADPQWSGEGLPPVGTACKYKNGVLPLRVFAVDGEYAAVANESARFWCLACDLTPINPSEQIAAEEREAAVAAMLELDPYLPNTSLGMMSRADFCRTLYDNGYRKQKDN